MRGAICLCGLEPAKHGAGETIAAHAWRETGGWGPSHVCQVDVRV
jgi:hypothetical protein